MGDIFLKYMDIWACPLIENYKKMSASFKRWCLTSSQGYEEWFSNLSANHNYYLMVKNQTWTNVHICVPGKNRILTFVFLGD